MRSWMTIRATRLHERKLVCNDSFTPRATLFPFFDRDGSIDHVLIVDAHTADLRAYRTDSTRTYIPLWGPIRVVGSITTLDEFVVEQLAPLWHFDPWWLLKAPRFGILNAVPVLKQTNCASAFDQQPIDMEFNLGLTEVQRVRFSVPAQEYQSRRLTPEMLPRREESSSSPPTPLPHREGWVLDPIWKT